MFEFFAWLKFFPEAFKKIFIDNDNNIRVPFILNVIKGIYFSVAGAAIYVVYYLFKALEETGILTSFKQILANNVQIIKNISLDCFPLILNLGDMMRCISGS